MTEEQKEAKKLKDKERYESLTDEQKAELLAKVNARNRNLTEEQRKAKAAKAKERLEAMSEERKQMFKERYAATRHAKKPLLTEEEKKARREERWAKLRQTPEQKLASRELTKQKQEIKRKQRVEENKIWIAEFKSTKCCEHCGENDPRVFDFHHVDPAEKEHGIAGMVHHKPLDQLKLEIAKCIILCANCHRKLHADLDMLPHKLKGKNHSS